MESESVIRVINLIKEKGLIIKGICHDKDSSTTKHFKSAFKAPYQKDEIIDIQGE